MEETDSVATLIDSTTSKIQQLQKAFAELESHRAVTLNLKWKELEEHFHGLERSLKRRFHELEGQEREYETKIRKSREILEKREAAVVAKEQASLGRLQEKRDATVFAITNALEKHRKTSPGEPVVVTGDCHYESLTVEVPPPDKHRKISAAEPVGVISDFDCESSSVEDPPPYAFSPECLSEESKNSLEEENFDGRSYPQLVKLCIEMDSEGLQKFISDNRKNLAVLREEIPLALEAAADPAQLVLNSLEDFYPMELSNVDGKKDSVLLGVRRTCIMLMECLSIMLMVSDLDLISEDVRDRAKEIAYDWKPKLETLDVDASNGNSLEAHAFLQLLATYGIASDFDEDILCRLIPMVSRRRQAADLCRYLGLSEKMPGVIEVLINSGRHIDAVNLAFAFELKEQFSPVPLLKAYLKDVRKTSPLKPGNTSPSTAQNEINERELSALKAVIRCIEEHKLEEWYPVDPLQKRLLQLGKAKEDQKRATETAKPLPKRPRANAGGCAPRLANVANVGTDKAFHPKVTDRYPHYVYDRSFVYPLPANHVPHVVGSATYNFTPSHGNYFVNGYQYPTPYLH